MQVYGVQLLLSEAGKFLLLWCCCWNHGEAEEKALPREKFLDQNKQKIKFKRAAMDRKGDNNYY